MKILNIQKQAFVQNLEKAFSGQGVYQDNYKNRKLGRVGQPYKKETSSKEKNEEKGNKIKKGDKVIYRYYPNTKLTVEKINKDGTVNLRDSNGFGVINVSTKDIKIGKGTFSKKEKENKTIKEGDEVIYKFYPNSKLVINKINKDGTINLRDYSGEFSVTNVPIKDIKIGKETFSKEENEKKR
jgi:co-chaperonin GroES (HSP10)